jgi:hypothetical protein
MNIDETVKKAEDIKAIFLDTTSGNDELSKVEQEISKAHAKILESLIIDLKSLQKKINLGKSLKDDFSKSCFLEGL